MYFVKSVMLTFKVKIESDIEVKECIAVDFNSQIGVRNVKNELKVMAKSFMVNVKRAKY